MLCNHKPIIVEFGRCYIATGLVVVLLIFPIEKARKKQLTAPTPMETYHNKWR